MVKNIFLLFFTCCLVSLDSFGQVDLLMENPDINKDEVTYCDAGSKGPSRLWDFSHVKTRHVYSCRDFLETDTSFVRMEKGKVSTFHQSEDSLFLLREETPLYHIDYMTPKFVSKVPSEYGEKYVSNFYGEGQYCGRHYMKRFGTVSMEVDGYGKLILAKGDTLENVLRIYTITTTAIRQNVDSCANDEDSGQQEISESYRWYVEGEQNPVYEIHSTTYYADASPYAFSQVAYRNYEKASNDEDEKEEENPRDSDNSYPNYTVTNNNGYLIIGFELGQSANAHFIIADLMGVMHKSESYTLYAGTQEVLIDCSSLRKGQYILYINLNGRIYSQKINIK
ncbi:T9SS type A sorting domain-containing protein [Prevotella sp. E13-17]|uniref:T9SS type A sorting domain-containing protein n=1 Tax=Prevotella sp. E13-17 TaxID=2913616 RepID=UPI001EDA9CBA|nr:T9SS type A sorting domain-containing protein [Prevotella sp. E13-17]UKK50763.1 T9SS type A sorting domain-containing protein [Prevotella sp. E13-17]